MRTAQPRRFKTITEFHQFRGLPKPEHPLVSVINVANMMPLPDAETNMVNDFYPLP
ncbi:hypothetical protein [Spirosoma validum]|uniref:Uncharacterized protein n=1 Tax=Spirosoma validum TaxID=2771355 RepID=A0A927B6L7_9BACT|nr:hypothetical protein [Spirosoma validum]MBD2756650.1 hypothetical protein [Spirosoma validum]